MPNKITLARIAYGISRADLARETGIPKRTLENWEYGKSKPSAGALLKVANLLNVPMETLIDEDN